jgi:transposase
MKKYTNDFKREAVRLADEPDRYDKQVERELGLYQGAIRHWREQLRANPDSEVAFPGRGHQTPAEEEIRKLRRELQIAREERDILKKAVAVFSTDPNRYSRS